MKLYDRLVAKVNNIDTSGLVKRAGYNTKIIEIEDKIPNSNSFVKRLITILKLLK